MPHVSPARAQVAQLLHHSCLEVGGDGGILDGMLQPLSEMVASDIDTYAIKCAAVLRELGADCVPCNDWTNHRVNGRVTRPMPSECAIHCT